MYEELLQQKMQERGLVSGSRLRLNEEDLAPCIDTLVEIVKRDRVVLLLRSALSEFTGFYFVKRHNGTFRSCYEDTLVTAIGRLSRKFEEQQVHLITVDQALKKVYGKVHELISDKGDNFPRRDSQLVYESEEILRAYIKEHCSLQRIKRVHWKV